MGKKEPNIDDPRILQIAAHLRKLRIAKGYSSYESFALDFDLPTIQYWRLETGTNFTIKSLLKVLDIHEISLQTFFKDME